jgi:hypothetical protein
MVVDGAGHVIVSEVLVSDRRRGGNVPRKNKSDEKLNKRKQYTGRVGRPREVEIGGAPVNQPVEVQRLSAISGTDAPKGVQRLSGGTPKVSGVEIISKGEPKSTG